MFDLITNVESCYYNIPQLIYYSHIPTAGIALLVGFFVFWSNRKSLANILLFLLAIDFSLWVVLDLFTWVDHDSRRIMFSWMSLIAADLLLFVISLYLLYVFLNKSDVKFVFKVFFALLTLPTFILMSTKYNVLGFDAASCNGMDGFVGRTYLYGAEAFLLLIMIVIAIRKIIAEKILAERLKNVYFSVGLLSFLGVFLVGNSVASIYETNNFLWSLSQYGLFGMTVFMGFLAYLIVKFKAFNIKLLGAQALVISLVALIASEFFFTPFENTTNVILISITVLLAAVLGMVLIDSVKKEVQRKEELQQMSDKLASANDQLRVLDNAKSEFISIASHQLRTPLTAIKGFLSLLLEGSYGKLTIKHKDVLNKIYTSNERLISLVEDLLNLSRIESGRMEYAFEKVDIAGVCQEVYDTFLLKAKDKKLDLCFQKNDGVLCEAVTDRNKVREVISNMVDNAIKYTLKGGVTMKVENNGEFVQVKVTDTGIGIPETELPYLFQKFSRGKDISRLNTGGTGLGLHVGKKMMEALHGDISAESRGEGKGSTFIIHVPMKVAEA